MAIGQTHANLCATYRHYQHHECGRQLDVQRKLLQYPLDYKKVGFGRIEFFYQIDGLRGPLRAAAMRPRASERANRA